MKEKEEEEKKKEEEQKEENEEVEMSWMRKMSNMRRATRLFNNRPKTEEEGKKSLSKI